MTHPGHLSPDLLLTRLLLLAGEPGPPAEFAHGTETAVAQAQRNIEAAGLGPSFGAVFVDEAELSETARGGCAGEDRRYLFPCDARGTWPVAGAGRQDGEEEQAGELGQAASESDASDGGTRQQSAEANPEPDEGSEEQELPWGGPASAVSPDDHVSRHDIAVIWVAFFSRS
eukprot:COSAG04_NODE_388_length_15249_cov_7.616502_3_plen_172_part_00